MSDQSTLKMKQLQADFKQINEHEEMREVFSLKDKDTAYFGMDEKEREYNTVKAAQQESLKIGELLDNAESLKLTDEQKNDMILRDNRNKNFMLLNNEKFRGDGIMMQKVKTGIANYESVIRTLGTDMESMRTEALSYIEEVITHCNAYLGRRRSIFIWRWSRYNAVKDALTRFTKEKEMLKNADLQQTKGLDVEVDLLSAISGKTRLGKKVALERRKKLEAENGERKKVINEKSNEYGAILKNEGEKIKNELNVPPNSHILRSASVQAILMKRLSGAGNDEMINDYKVLSADLETCNQVEKVRKIETMEKVFSHILSYDLKAFDYKSLNDVSGANVLKNKYICNLAMDSDVLFSEYEKLVKNGDPNIALNETQFKEVKARRGFLQAVNTWVDALQRIYNSEGGVGVDVERYLNYSFDELEVALDDLNGVVCPESIVLSNIINMKLEFDGFGLGTGPDTALQNEREKLGLGAGSDGTDSAKQAIKDAKKRREEHREKERKAAKSGGERIGEALDDRVKVNAPNGDIDNMMAARKERLEKERLEKEEKARLKREKEHQEFQDEINAAKKRVEQMIKDQEQEEKERQERLKRDKELEETFNKIKNTEKMLNDMIKQVDKDLKEQEEEERRKDKEHKQRLREIDLMIMEQEGLTEKELKDLYKEKEKKIQNNEDDDDDDEEEFSEFDRMFMEEEGLTEDEYRKMLDEAGEKIKREKENGV